MNLHKNLDELLSADVITPETAERIQDYYKNKDSSSSNRLFIVFGILGAILVGLGIILIIAHNWDEFSRATKTFFAFLPLIVGQLFCGFALTKRLDSLSWRESSAAFLFFAIGASISLISQIYNIPGDIESFMLTWMALCLPLVYIMKSSIASLLFICGITYYASSLGYWSYPSTNSYYYWLLLLAVFPYYYKLYNKKSENNFLIFHNWIIPLSIIICLGTLAKSTEELMFVAYFSLFGFLYLIGDSDFFKNKKTRNNGYKILGSLGTVILLLFLSFDAIWKELRTENFYFEKLITAPEFYAAVVLSILAGTVFYFQYKKRNWNEIKPMAPVFILFIATFILGMFSTFAVIFINMFVLGIGILTIRQGENQDHLGILNYGLLIITALVICRFFDTDLSFVLRGIMFVLVGAGFFATNYWMLKKRKTNE